MLCLLGSVLIYYEEPHRRGCHGAAFRPDAEGFFFLLPSARRIAPRIES